jgi:MFS family permease
LAVAAALRDVLGNREIRRLEISWTIGTAADWAFLVVLLIVAYDAGGAFAVGVLGAVRVLPAIVAPPFAMKLVQRFGGNRVLIAINLARFAGAAATAIVIGAGLPVEAMYTLAAVVAGAGSLVWPIQLALLPAFARTPGELVAANAASSTGEGVGTFAGPLIAGALVAWVGPVPASVLVAAGFVGAAVAATGLRFERDADAHGGVGADRGARFRLADAPQVLRRYPSAVLIMGAFVAQVFVRGLLITLIVVASIELLGMGDSGVGLLNAAIGLGGLVGALGALGLVGGKRLTSVFAIALAGWGLPLVVIGGWPVALLALVGLFVTGICNAVLDVSGFTLIQRGVQNEDRVTMLGVFEGALGTSLLVGSLLAPALIAALGARGAFVVAGAILPVVAVVTWRPIAKGVGRGALTDELSVLLRSNPLFAPLPLTALDRLAENLELVSFEPGDVVMRKGESGAHYVLIAEGEVEVRDEGHLLRVCGPGDGVGEIALVRGTPRTATVVARTRVVGYAIAAATFLAAVAGPAAAAAVAAVASARLERSRLDPASP